MYEEYTDLALRVNPDNVFQVALDRRAVLLERGSAHLRTPAARQALKAALPV